MADWLTTDEYDLEWVKGIVKDNYRFWCIERKPPPGTIPNWSTSFSNDMRNCTKFVDNPTFSLDQLIQIGRIWYALPPDSRSAISSADHRLKSNSDG